MLSFSQRKGLEPIKSVIQIDNIDKELLNGLWNSLYFHYWSRVKSNFEIEESKDYRMPYHGIGRLIERIWLGYFKETRDTLPIYWHQNYDRIRDYFFSCKWNKVYEFLEFIANNYEVIEVNEKFMKYCNSVLERELSAYRFVGGIITQITSAEEINEIEKVLEAPEPLETIKIHLKNALEKMSNRENPDYRNSIKESISAVESLCRLITKEPKVTLGDALNAIEKIQIIKLHPALKEAYGKIYGYTCDADGIRHALLDEPSLDFNDAKYMLVSCSTFINYLISKSTKAGIKLS
jgi:hypothetical protein